MNKKDRASVTSAFDFILKDIKRTFNKRENSEKEYSEMWEKELSRKVKPGGIKYYIIGNACKNAKISYRTNEEYKAILRCLKAERVIHEAVLNDRPVFPFENINKTQEK